MAMPRKLKRFKSSGEDSLKTMVESKDPEIVYTVLGSIYYGIDKGLDAVECFEVESTESIVTFKMSRGEWKICLGKLLEDMVVYEDYESCLTIQKYIKILEMKCIEVKKDI